VVDVCLEGGREGIEVGRWMREIFEVPVVFVTSYSDDDTVARIRALVPGAPVLPKPVYTERLADAIAEARRTRAPVS
jgi:DNA-binding response OmpR family regulator